MRQGRARADLAVRRARSGQNGDRSGRRGGRPLGDGRGPVVAQRHDLVGSQDHDWHHGHMAAQRDAEKPARKTIHVHRLFDRKPDARQPEHRRDADREAVSDRTAPPAERG